MLMLSAALHVVMLAALRSPALQPPQLSAFEPMEVTLLDAEAPAPEAPHSARRTPASSAPPVPAAAQSVAPPSPPADASASSANVARKDSHVESATAPTRLSGRTSEASRASASARGHRLRDEVEGPETGTSRLATRLDPIVEARADVAALNNPKPAYPLAARRRGVEGRVLVSAHVHADGSCAEVRLKRSSGHVLLDESALDAVRRWRFLPARRAGAPIDSWVDVPVSFRLDG
jgi:protein TonB